MEPTSPQGPKISDQASKSGARETGISSLSNLPERFGKYTLLRKLATGGMAELFLALQKSVAGFEKLVVIKRILPKIHHDQAFIDMLLHEARVAATLSHPNIVQIFDVGQVDGTYFIAMEHVHGEDVRSIARQMRRAPPEKYGEFPREHAVSILRGVCAGLAYAHEKRDLDGTPLRIVHRDVSPQNVVVTFSGDVKLVDFGIAKSDGALSPDTKGGKLKGKVPYMSPEQARGEPLDARSDIFSAGVILFELTTGRRLFKTSSEYETLKLICERSYPKPSEVVADYPEALEAIVLRALAKDKSDRFQSAREMQAALDEFARREQMVVSPIALQQFMRTLFEDKHSSQEDARLYGKHLAGSAELAPSPEPPSSEKEFVGAQLSMPAASHTVTGDHPRGGKVLPWALALVATAALAIVLFGTRSPRRAPVETVAAPAQDREHAVTEPPVPASGTEHPAAEPAPAPVPVIAQPKPANVHAAMGKISVAAAGGWCNVVIDGKAFGATPIAGIELPAGLHKVACTTEGGKAQSATVRVPAQGIARHRFQL